MGESPFILIIMLIIANSKETAIIYKVYNNKINYLVICIIINN